MFIEAIHRLWTQDILQITVHAYENINFQEGIVGTSSIYIYAKAACFYYSFK